MKRKPSSTTQPPKKKYKRVRKLCIKPGCKNHQRQEGEKPQYCKKHGGGQRCKVKDCTNAATDKTNLLCKRHGGQRCKKNGCNKSARSKSDFCFKHGGGQRCQRVGCTKSVQGTTDFCLQHGGGYRCQGCGLFGSTRKNYMCSYCKTGVVRHPKEQEMVDYLNEHIEQKMTLQDGAIGGNLCLKYRPDVLYGRPLKNIIVECDEWGHEDEIQYPASCERKRMELMQKTSGVKTVFIRYNPDGIKRDPKTMNIKKEIKLAQVAARVKYHLDHDPTKLLTVEYINYPEDSIHIETCRDLL